MKEIFDIIVRINRERGVTILLVEQNANMALQVADFGYVLEVGRIVMADTCARLLEKDDIKEFYLGRQGRGRARAAAAGRSARPGARPWPANQAPSCLILRMISTENRRLFGVMR